MIGGYSTRPTREMSYPSSFWRGVAIATPPALLLWALLALAVWRFL